MLKLARTSDSDVACVQVYFMIQSGLSTVLEKLGNLTNLKVPFLDD